MLCGLAMFGIAIIITIISTGSEASSKLYYDLIEDAGDLRSGSKSTVITVKDSATKSPAQPAKPAAISKTAADDVDTLAQSIYDSTEM